MASNFDADDTPEKESTADLSLAKARGRGASRKPSRNAPAAAVQVRRSNRRVVTEDDRRKMSNAEAKQALGNQFKSTGLGLETRARATAKNKRPVDEVEVGGEKSPKKKQFTGRSSQLGQSSGDESDGDDDDDDDDDDEGGGGGGGGDPPINDPPIDPPDGVDRRKFDNNDNVLGPLQGDQMTWGLSSEDQDSSVAAAGDVVSFFVFFC